MVDQNATNTSLDRQISVIASCIGSGCIVESAKHRPMYLLEAGLAERLQASVMVINASPSMKDGQFLPAEIESSIVHQTALVSDAVVIGSTGRAAMSGFLLCTGITLQ